MTLTFFGLIDAVRHHVSQLDSCITCTINFKEKKKKSYAREDRTTGEVVRVGEPDS